MGDRRDIMLVTKSKLTGDIPRKSTKFKSLFDRDQNGVGFTFVVGSLTYLMFTYLI